MTFLSPAMLYHFDGVVSKQMHVISIPWSPVKNFSTVNPEPISVLLFRHWQQVGFTH